MSKNKYTESERLKIYGRLLHFLRESSVKNNLTRPNFNEEELALIKEEFPGLFERINIY
jgi:hypothetical protein